MVDVAAVSSSLSYVVDDAGLWGLDVWDPCRNENRCFFVFPSAAVAGASWRLSNLVSSVPRGGDVDRPLFFSSTPPRSRLLDLERLLGCKWSILLPEVLSPVLTRRCCGRRVDASKLSSEACDDSVEIPACISCRVCCFGFLLLVNFRKMDVMVGSRVVTDSSTRQNTGQQERGNRFRHLGCRC